MLALAGILLLLIAAESVRELADAEPGQSVIFDLVNAVAEALLGAYIVAAVALVVGATVYLLGHLRGVRITIPEAIFNRAVVLAAAGAAPPGGVRRLSMLGGTCPALGLFRDRGGRRIRRGTPPRPRRSVQQPPQTVEVIQSSPVQAPPATASSSWSESSSPWPSREALGSTR
jgi:hypothetical protein